MIWTNVFQFYLRAINNLFFLSSYTISTSTQKKFGRMKIKLFSFEFFFRDLQLNSSWWFFFKFRCKIWNAKIEVNYLRPNNFLTMEVFNELSHFDIFLHITMLEIYNFNHTKVKITLSSLNGINYRIQIIGFLDYNNFGWSTL